MTVSVERLLALRRGLAAARANALQDAEGIADLLVAIEDVGAFYSGGYGSLEEYERPLTEDLMKGPEQQDFQKLFKVVKWSRNAGVHAGSWARHATANAVELALLLEDALGRKCMEGNKSAGSNQRNGKGRDQSDWRVEHFMVRDPICAQLWHTIADVRRAMLRNSFSYLPIWTAAKDGEECSWQLIADHAVAKWLGSPSRMEARKGLGRLEVKAAIDEGLVLTPARTLLPISTWGDAIKITQEIPAMVIKNTEQPEQIVGIVTAFDLL